MASLDILYKREEFGGIGGPVSESVDIALGLGRLVLSGDKDAAAEPYMRNEKEQLRTAIGVIKDIEGFAKTSGDMVGEEFVIDDNEVTEGYRFVRYFGLLLDELDEEYPNWEDEEEAEEEAPDEDPEGAEKVVLYEEKKEKKTRFSRPAQGWPSGEGPYVRISGDTLTFKSGAKMDVERTWENNMADAKESVFTGALTMLENLIDRHGSKLVLAFAAALAASPKGFRTTRGPDNKEIHTLITVNDGVSEKKCRLTTSELRGVKLALTSMSEEGLVSTSDDRVFGKASPLMEEEPIFLKGQNAERKDRWMKSYNLNREGALKRTKEMLYRS